MTSQSASEQTDMIKEDQDERRQFDMSAKTFGSPLEAVAVALEIWGKMSNQNASYAQQCYIMANEVRRAERPGWREDDVLRALCCPEGCLRPDDCWARKGPGRMFRLQQAKAVCALNSSVAEWRALCVKS